jgi:hypothetical protein
MKIRTSVVVLGLGVLAGCGGGGGGGGTTGPATNAFTGTLSITSAKPAGTVACAGAHTVTFTSAGASVHVVGLAGGDCLVFTNGDTASHQPASIGSPACPELDGPTLAQGGAFTSAPLDGPKDCHWQDSLNPPTAGGGGGGTGGY